MKQWSLTLRVFVVGAVLVAVFGSLALRQVLEEVKPAVRQSTEETLVDTANLLAELVAEDLRAGRLQQGDLSRVMAAYGKRDPGAEIWGIRKDGVTHRIYITDADGIVLLDSTGRDVGSDYSRWNDVYRTLHGSYGARTTEEVPGDENSTVMYVAAPVRDADRIIGVVTVAKPNRSVQPFIERARHRPGHWRCCSAARGWSSVRCCPGGSAVPSAVSRTTPMQWLQAAVRPCPRCREWSSRSWRNPWIPCARSSRARLTSSAMCRR